MLDFVVVGTGRCGTAYMAELLTRMGIPCGHEWVFSAHPRRYPDLDIVGDSSAQAVPFLHEFTGLVLHQVRDPLRVIGSFLGFGLFKDPVAHGIDGQFMMRHFQFTGDELGDAIRYYVEWNERCERVEQSRYLRYQLEQIDVGLLRHICQFLREDVSESVIQEALQSVPRNFNTRASTVNRSRGTTFRTAATRKGSANWPAATATSKAWNPTTTTVLIGGSTRLPVSLETPINCSDTAARRGWEEGEHNPNQYNLKEVDSPTSTRG